jgi:hypothetical protein
MTTFSAGSARCQHSVSSVLSSAQMKGNPNQLSDAEQLGKDVAAAGFTTVELRSAPGYPGQNLVALPML